MKRRIDTQLAAQSEPCKEALYMISKASFVGGDGLDYVETAVALSAIKVAQEPYEDCISRAAAIDALKKISFSHWFEYGEYLSEDTREIKIISSSKALEVIEALPSAQPEQRWIPVSERLPEYGVAVLTYDGHCFCVEKRIPTIRDDEGEPITGDWWVSDDYDEYDSDYYPNLRDGACIAWMPLPKPYRAERRTDE